MMEMDLLEYAREKGILKQRKALVVEVRRAGDTVTVIYRIEGQKYLNDQYSARSLNAEEVKATKVDKDTGELLTGSIYKKSNFWCWKPLEDSNEA